MAGMVAEGTVITHGAHVYNVGSLISAGAFGRVYNAQRVKPDPATQLAIKVPSDERLRDPVWARKFAREARILANISHRNVVKIVAFFEFPNGEMALAQELVQGAKKLPDFVRDNPGHIASILLQSLYALQAFHGGGGEQAAIHRDLSPSNILVDETGMVKVIDFGLAKEMPRQTEVITAAGQFFGTPGCIAPEQMVSAATVDHRADLFALGKTITAAIQDRDPTHAIPYELKEPWRTICLKLCEHQYADRYRNATEALSATLFGLVSAGISLPDLALHVEEMNLSNEIIPGWPEMCSLYFKSVLDIDQEELELLAEINAGVFTDPGFDANAIFEKMELQSAIQAFEAGFGVSFEDCDALGEVYARLYPALSLDNKLRCFERLCKTAVQWHRYSVMGNVRKAWGKESNFVIEVQLMEIIDRVDPQKVIRCDGMSGR